MSEPIPVATRSERRAARHHDAVADSASRQMADRRFDVVRTSGRRRALAGCLIIAIAMTSFLFWFGWWTAATAALILSFGLWLLLRIAVRTMADLPVEFLDERQAQVRAEAYVESYRWIAGLGVMTLSGAMIAYMLTGSDPDQLTVTITLNQLQAVFWAFIGLALSLPSLVIALREPSI